MLRRPGQRDEARVPVREGRLVRRDGAAAAEARPRRDHRLRLARAGPAAPRRLLPEDAQRLAERAVHPRLCQVLYPSAAQGCVLADHLSAPAAGPLRDALLASGHHLAVPRPQARGLRLRRPGRGARPRGRGLPGRVPGRDVDAARAAAHHPHRRGVRRAAADPELRAALAGGDRGEAGRAADAELQLRHLVPGHKHARERAAC
mmetsp:Transcript_52289/g.167666  ORF Transcript_52289/g.167666 Transcript_52289/m.167666 type:complete len:204 (+) Transcript_52289:280-891(+)